MRLIIILKIYIKYLRYKMYKIYKNNKKKSNIAIGMVVTILLLFISALVVDVVNLDGTFGNLQKINVAEIQAEVQSITDDSIFRVKVNTRPSMDADTGSVSIIVQNAIDNPYLKKVVYYNAMGEKVYETATLYPGGNELTAKFPGNWKKGNYPMTAHVIAVDGESLEEFIVTELEIELTVK